MAGEDYIEAMLTWTEAGPQPYVDEWLTAHGFDLLPMRVGRLIQGDYTTFAAAFDKNLCTDTLPVSLPVPPELAAAVASIRIPKPAQIYEGERKP